MNSLVLAVTPLVSLWFCAVCVFITYHPLSAPRRSSVAKGDRFRAILLGRIKKTMGWITTSDQKRASVSASAGRHVYSCPPIEDPSSIGSGMEIRHAAPDGAGA